MMLFILEKVRTENCSRLAGNDRLSINCHKVNSIFLFWLAGAQQPVLLFGDRELPHARIRDVMTYVSSDQTLIYIVQSHLYFTAMCRDDELAPETEEVDDAGLLQEVGGGPAEQAPTQEQHGAQQRRMAVGVDQFIDRGLGMKETRQWPYDDGLG